MRYLEKLPEKIKVGGVVFSAGWITLKNLEDEETKEIARPWLETTLDFKKIRSHFDKWVAIFSDNDSYLPLKDKELFRFGINAN